MNLFILDYNPSMAARYYCDKHVVKIILESYQMLSNCFSQGAYYNHPMSIWVRTGRENYIWTYTHALSLCDEFYFRYEKEHSYYSKLQCFDDKNKTNTFCDIPLTDWPRCFGKYKSIIPETDDVVQDYRNYYMLAKRNFARWKNTNKPYWWK